MAPATTPHILGRYDFDRERLGHRHFRVWSGREAVKLGLVDEIGGLDVALRYAAEKAGLGENPTVSEYPRKKELAEVIADLLQKSTPPELGEHSLAAQVAHRFARELATLRAFNDPRGIYARLPVEVFVP